MNDGLPRHPGAEEIAEFGAGMTDGARGDQLAAHLAECPECNAVNERLVQVPVILASIPRPAIPADVEARIMAAIRDLAGASPGGRPSALPDRAPGGQAGDLDERSDAAFTAWRRHLPASVGVLVAAAACLVLAFIGLRLSGPGHPGVTGASSAGRSASAGSVAGPRQNSLSPAFTRSGGKTSFPVLVSTTDFRSATLQAQVMQQLAALSQARGEQTPGRISPSKSLVGCVTRLAAGTRPTLVEEAAYQSRPAYVIVIPTHAWVVARDCTLASPSVLASVPLSPSR